jgi:hypothetical protein
MSRTIQVTFDANNPTTLADFWLDALSYERPSPPDDFDTWDAFALDKGIPAEDWDRFDALVDPDGDGPRLFFQKVPEGKASKNRVHLDLKAADPDSDAAAQRIAVDAEVGRLVGIGATKIEDFNEPGFGVWTVMNDPEGNEFCVD